MKLHPTDKIEVLGKNYIKQNYTPCFKCIDVNRDLLDYTVANGHSVCELCCQYCSFREYPVLRLCEKGA